MARKQEKPSGGFRPITVAVAPDPKFRPIEVGTTAAPVAAPKIEKPATGEKREG